MEVFHTVRSAMLRAEFLRRNPNMVTTSDMVLVKNAKDIADQNGLIQESHTLHHHSAFLKIQYYKWFFRIHNA